MKPQTWAEHQRRPGHIADSIDHRRRRLPVDACPNGVVPTEHERHPEPRAQDVSCRDSSAAVGVAHFDRSGR